MASLTGKKGKLMAVQLRERREAAEAKQHAWHQALTQAIVRDWPNPVVLEGRVIAVSTEIVEQVLGTSEFVRRREAEIAQAP